MGLLGTFSKDELHSASHHGGSKVTRQVTAPNSSTLSRTSTEAEAGQPLKPDYGAYKTGLDASQPANAKESADKDRYEGQLGGMPTSSVAAAPDNSVAAAGNAGSMAALQSQKDKFGSNMAPGQRP